MSLTNLWQMPNQNAVQTDILQGNRSLGNTWLNALTNLGNSLLNQPKPQTNPYISYTSNFANIMTGLSSLSDVWLGFKNYQIAKKQMSLAQEQADRTRQELERIRKVRNRLTAKYMGKE